VKRCQGRCAVVASALGAVRFRTAAALLLTAPWIAPPSAASFQFPVNPDWQSTPQAHVSTGCALRDLNHDGLPDLVVANGNDMARQPLVVYLNQGGVFPLTPTWVSDDIDYQGQLDLADVDGDGNQDCAVAVYIGASGFSTPGRVKLYHGNGDGTFSRLPVWASSEPFYCFSVAFGDVDLDGRPDLACAAGESYNRIKERFRLFRNIGGALDPTPYWQCDLPHYALDVAWGDINNDGNPDLAFACESNVPDGDPFPYPSEVYFGNGTSLATTPGWQTEDGHDTSNTVALGDVNGDGWLDLAVADNNQGHEGDAEFGRFKIFLNDGAGRLSARPDWTSSIGGYGSNVSFADADADGDLDLATGWWWGPVRIYENQGGVFPTTPAWQSNTGSVIENIAWEDVDNDGLSSSRVQTFTGNGTRRLFVLPRRPVRVVEAMVDGEILGPADYFVSPEQGWLTIGSAPGPGITVEVRYVCSVDLDFAVSNWDSAIGNYLFRNGLSAAGAENGGPGAEIALRLAPNPTRAECRITLPSHRQDGDRVEIYSVGGARVWAGAPGSGTTETTVQWDGRDEAGRRAAVGTYWVRVLQGDRATSARLIVIR
jgi:hypothetical protein